jgi:hypothetical protein
MEQLVLILIIAVISFVNWLIKKAGEARERQKLERQKQLGTEPELWQEPSAGEPTEPSAPTEDPDASMRRLMEALGLPMDAEPPPVPVQPAPQTPPSPPPQVAVLPPPLPQAVAPKAPERPALPTAKISAKPFPAESTPDQMSARPVRDLLSSPDSLKKAIILTEILGAPKALRS